MFHSLPPEKVLQSLHSSEKGLSLEEVTKRQQQGGKNEILSKDSFSTWKLFFSQFQDVLILLLLFASLLSLLLGEWLDAFAMISIVFMTAGLGFFQEFQAEKAVEALQKLSSPQSKVLRDGSKHSIPSEELVTGDILFLEAGDLVPADGRLLQTSQLKINEASLTGESLPVFKDTHALEESISIASQTNMVFMGTVVENGKATAVITNIGMKTELGKIATQLTTTEVTKTPLQIKFGKLGSQIAYLFLGVVFFVIALKIFQKPASIGWVKYSVEMMLFGLSLSVAAIPTSLPAIVTIGLSLGTRSLADKKMIIKKLPAAESLGSVTVICSDKTGTLTKNEMTVRNVCLEQNTIEITGKGYETKGEFLFSSSEKSSHALHKLLEIAILNNHSSFEITDGNIEKFGDATELALLVLNQKSPTPVSKELYNIVEEFPFDSSRKRMSSVIENQGERWVACKGAPDVLAPLCSHCIDEKGKIREFTPEIRERWNSQNEAMASKALRVLAFAYKPVESQKTYSMEECESNLVWVGLTGMMDPPRNGVLETIRQTKEAGIQVIVITGDHAKTAEAIGREIGLFQDGDCSLTGDELQAKSEDELMTILPHLRIVSRALPEHKMKIVQVLQKMGHVVAMTGDGVNDAPALKKADIGLAMGITGSDVAKSVSKAIIADDNFSSIVNGIEEGRNIYDRILKSTLYLLSCNVGEIITVFLAVLLGLPLPLLALQLLLMNLVTDGLPALALGVEPADKNIMKRTPRNPAENPLNARAWTQIISFGSIMAVGTLALFYFYQNKGIEYSRTVAFTALVLFEMFAVLGARSLVAFERVNPFSNRWLVLAVLSSMSLHLLVVYWKPFQVLFKTQSLDLATWGVLLLVSSMGWLFMELTKLISIPNTKKH